MTKLIPSPEEVRAALADLSASAVQKLADTSGVPYHTLLKIKDGTTSNPRLRTVRQLWPFIAMSQGRAVQRKAKA